MELTPDSMDDIREIKADVKEIRKLLLGNGQIGLCEQSRIQAAAMQAQDAVLQALKQDLATRIPITPARWRIMTVVIGLVGLLVLWHVVTGEWNNLPKVLWEVKKWF